MQELEYITKSKNMFTEYHSWFKEIKDTYDIDHCKNNNSLNMEIPLTIYWLLKDIKGTKYIREILENR